MDKIRRNAQMLFGEISGTGTGLISAASASFDLSSLPAFAVHRAIAALWQSRDPRMAFGSRQVIDAAIWQRGLLPLGTERINGSGG